MRAFLTVREETACLRRCFPFAATYLTVLSESQPHHPMEPKTDRLIARFELGTEKAQPVAPPQPTQRTVTALKTTGVRGGAAPVFAASEDQWDEF